MKRSAILSFGLTYLVATSAWANPAIHTHSISNDGKITLFGMGFGAGPDVVLYDDMRNANVSSSSVELSPLKGNWFEVKKAKASEIVEGPFGPDSQAIIVAETGSANGARPIFGEPDPTGIHGLKHFQEIYYSFALQDLGSFPHGTEDEFATISASKDSWLMFGDRGDSTRYSVEKLGEPSGHDLAVPTWIGGVFSIGGNNTRMNPLYRQQSLRDNWVFGGWVTYMFHAKLNPDDPYGNAEGFFAYLNEKAYDKNTRTGNFMTDQTEEGVPYPYWDRVRFNAWVRHSSETQIRRAMSNFYVAIGDNANARVLLTNGETLGTSTRVQHLLPETWSDDQIRATLPKDWASDNLFVHIADSDNNYSQGYRIECGECTPPDTIKLNIE
ncbi:hypothetical protein [Marinobacter vulgaris]|uniref:hypothetical protein n=1 Tax=Marinobacter vulgaris TaxID=1928331 RepID=UPI001183FE97|nr:hypothetical protein [Marinobacter vulgaris]TSJ70298.1 hypothetical protein FPC41_11215 [Marinobacter vulgaris]